jgi:hypothetical protein
LRIFDPKEGEPSKNGIRSFNLQSRILCGMNAKIKKTENLFLRLFCKEQSCGELVQDGRLVREKVAKNFE